MSVQTQFTAVDQFPYSFLNDFLRFLALLQIKFIPILYKCSQPWTSHSYIFYCTLNRKLCLANHTVLRMKKTLKNVFLQTQGLSKTQNLVLKFLVTFITQTLSLQEYFRVFFILYFMLLNI